LLGLPATGVIERDLLAVDRIMQRWAVANGSGLPEEEWDDTPRARPAPLDDETAMLVDEIVRKCPPRTRRILVAWYRKPLPTKILAQQMGMSPRTLENAWRLSLNFLKWKFEESRSITLARLLKVRH
jgi:DNA-directed RNA polymerase specialized sigma24 family protein